MLMNLKYLMHKVLIGYVPLLFKEGVKRPVLRGTRGGLKREDDPITSSIHYRP